MDRRIAEFLTAKYLGGQASPAPESANLLEIDAIPTKNPSEVTEKPWIWVTSDRGRTKQEDSGKWMMFFSNEFHDTAWLLAKNAFAEGLLEGVEAMKTSTRFSNPRASDERTGVILFYTSTARDEGASLAIAERILRAMRPVPDERFTPYIYYKSDRQTMEGTGATGQKRNWTYRAC